MSLLSGGVWCKSRVRCRHEPHERTCSKPQVRLGHEGIASVLNGIYVFCGSRAVH